MDAASQMPLTPLGTGGPPVSRIGLGLAALGDRLALYQVHSLTEDSGALSDDALLSALAGLRDDGVLIGLSTSGPRQADTLRRALAVSAGGKPLFSAAR